MKKDFTLSFLVIDDAQFVYLHIFVQIILKSGFV